ncbi:MAG: PqiC family protein [Rudaea sp.]|nr:PqiC family protein [Rudaea sp.]
MLRPLLRLLTPAIAVLLASCASAPTHFYTLLPPVQVQAPAVPPAGFAIDFEPVVVPAEVDQASWLIRTGPGQVALLDNERWAVPLADELRAVLADELTQRLGAREADDGTDHAGVPVYRIRMQVRRFESVPGKYALIEADWTVAGAQGDRVLSCGSRVSRTVEPGYPALALGHQRALEAIAESMAFAVRGVAAGNPACPPAQAE